MMLTLVTNRSSGRFKSREELHIRLGNYQNCGFFNKMLVQYKIHSPKSDNRQLIAEKSLKLTIVLGLFNQINFDDEKLVSFSNLSKFLFFVQTKCFPLFFSRAQSNCEK